jgi:hypothetical protein
MQLKGLADGPAMKWLVRLYFSSIAYLLMEALRRPA